MWVERVATQAAGLADALQPAAVQGAGSSIVTGADLAVSRGWLRGSRGSGKGAVAA